MESKTRPYSLSKRTMDHALELFQRGCKGTTIAEILGISNQSCSLIHRVYEAVDDEDWDYVRKLSARSANVVDWALEKHGKTIPAISGIDEESNETDCEFCFEEEPTLSEIKESLDNIARLLENIIKLWK